MESEKRRSHKKLCSSSISQVILDTRSLYEKKFTHFLCENKNEILTSKKNLLIISTDVLKGENL